MFREYHEITFQQRVEERKERLDVLAEQMRLKEEAKQFMLVRKQRMEEFKKEELKAKVERDKERALILQKQKEELKEVRAMQKKKLNEDRKKLEAAVQDFIRTGEWEQPRGLETVSDSMLGDKPDEELLAAAKVDKNPAAKLLSAGEPIKVGNRVGACRCADGVLGGCAQGQVHVLQGVCGPPEGDNQVQADRARRGPGPLPGQRDVSRADKVGVHMVQGGLR